MASTRLTADSTGQFEHRLVVPWHMLSAFCRHYADSLQATPDEIEAVEVKAKLIVSSSEGLTGTVPSLHGDAVPFTRTMRAVSGSFPTSMTQSSTRESCKELSRSCETSLFFLTTKPKSRASHLGTMP